MKSLREWIFLDAEVYVGGPVEQNTLHFVYVGEKKDRRKYQNRETALVGR